MCCSNAVTEKPTVGPTFFGAFPSDRMPKETNDVIVRFFLFTVAIPVSYTGNVVKLLRTLDFIVVPLH